jgi:alkanesulfonate monooxygenase SsuD/methylene tetrahydromethanopterin reductase-like flavin-dependent oxidoreductase (luciferase family)
MKLGIFQTVQWPEGTEQRDRYREAVDQVLAVERLGYDSVWLPEHHFTRHGITSDSLNVLSYLAARTERIRLGTAVSVLPFHDPVRLAESAALVDHLSQGRLDFGIGRGYQWSEYHGFGFGLDEGSDRFEEALEVLLQSWRATEPFAFDGKYHQYDAAFPQPRPLQLPHPPIYHATASADGLARCAENGWGVMLAQGTPLAKIADTVALYRQQLDRLGKPFDPNKLVLARGMFCASSTDEAVDAFVGPYAQFLERAARISAPPPSAGEPHRNPFDPGDQGVRDSLVCGDPDECIRAMDEIAELGVGQVLFFFNIADVAHDRVLASLELFAEHVLPRFAD